MTTVISKLVRFPLHMVKIFETFSQDYDLILSDSCTCTSDNNSQHKKDFWKDYQGSQFRDELIKYGFEGESYAIWKSLYEMNEAIKWFKNEGYNTERIAVICAGIDIKKGKKYCQESLSDMRKQHEVDIYIYIYNAIPAIEFCKTRLGEMVNGHDMNHKPM